jgi:hypothetical protein
MRTLKNILESSVLGDIDSTISKNAYELVYPAPTVKDFQKNGYTKASYVEWQCPDLIKNYINTIKDNPTNFHFDRSEVKGLRCNIDKDKTITTSLIGDSGIFICDLVGVGDWVSNSLPAAKKACIEFLTRISKNPDLMQKVIDCHNKCVDEQYKYGFCDCVTYDKIV